MSWDVSEIPRTRGHIHLHIDGSVARLVLDNPEACNAMSVGMMMDLVAAVDRIALSDVRAVLLYGAGESGFCAGGDLRDVRKYLMNEPAAKGMSQMMGDTLDTLSTLPVVVVVAVEGAALGGGAELVTAADWVVASSGATLGFVHAALGVSPGWGGAHRLIRRVGRNNACSMLLQAKRYGAEEAQTLGLVDQVSADGGAVTAATEWLDSVLRHPASSIAGALEILRCTHGSEPARLQVERAVFSRLWAGEAHCSALGIGKADG